jgi:Recombinase
MDRDQTTSRTTRSPRPWLILKSQIGPRFEVRPEQAAAALWMFRASESGLSDNEILKRMPSRFAPWSASGRWSRLIVSRTLRDKTLLGGKHKGRSYPPIIEQELFEAAKTAREERSLIARGRRDRGRHDVFFGLINCDYCGKRMKFRSDSPEAFYFCNNEICPGRGIKWLYRDFVASYDAFAGKSYRRGLALTELGDRDAIEFEMKFLEEQRAERLREVESLYRQVSEIERKLVERKREIRALGRASSARGRDRHLDRSEQNRISQLVRAAVFEIRLLPAGTTPRLEERVEIVKKAKFSTDVKAEVIKSMRKLEGHKMFEAKFKDGMTVFIIPSKKNPRLVQWREADGEPIELGKRGSTTDLPQVIAFVSSKSVPHALMIEFGDAENGAKTSQ